MVKFKKFLSVLIVIIMILSTFGIAASAVDVDSMEILSFDTFRFDWIDINGGTNHVRKGDTVYYPITINTTYYRSTNQHGRLFTQKYSELVSRKTGLADGKTIITTHVVYDADSLQFYGVPASEALFKKGGCVKTTPTAKETDPEILEHLNFTNAKCFDLTIEIFNLEDIEQDMVLFCFKFKVLKENFLYLDESTGKYYTNKILQWNYNFNLEVIGNDGVSYNFNRLIRTENTFFFFELDSADYSALTKKYENFEPFDVSELSPLVQFLGGANHYRSH